MPFAYMPTAWGSEMAASSVMMEQLKQALSNKIGVPTRFITLIHTRKGAVDSTTEPYIVEDNDMLLSFREAWPEHFIDDGSGMERAEGMRHGPTSKRPARKPKSAADAMNPTVFLGGGS